MPMAEALYSRSDKVVRFLLECRADPNQECALFVWGTTGNSLYTPLGIMIDTEGNFFCAHPCAF